MSRRLVVGVRHEHGVQNVDAPASQAEDGLALAFALVSLAVVVDPRGGCFRLEKAARKCPLEAMVAEPCGSVAANRSAGLVRSGPQPGVRRQGPNEPQGVPRGDAYEPSPPDRSILRQLSFTLIRRSRVRHAFPTCHRRCRGCRFRRRLPGYSSQRRRCFRYRSCYRSAHQLLLRRHTTVRLRRSGPVAGRGPRQHGRAHHTHRPRPDRAWCV